MTLSDSNHSGHAVCFESRFESIEEFCQTLNVLGWNAEMRQLEKGAGINSFSTVATQYAAAICFDFERRNHQIALPPSGFTTFGLPARPQAPGRIANRSLESESILNIDPEQGMDAVVEGGFSGLTLAFPDERIHYLGECLELPDEVLRYERGTERQPNAATIDQLREAAQGAIRLLQQNPENTAAITLLESELPMAMIEAWHGGRSMPRGKAHTRYRVMRRALEYIDAHPAEPHSIEALCSACATSVSTLERAFRDHFGVSPKTYLTLFRLAGLRRALVAAEPQTTVTQAANDWGFWHMGKLAADYRRAYNELPSATLARARSGSLPLAG